MAAELKTLVLVYPNQRWHKDDFQTQWNLNPSTLCLLAAVVDDIVNVEIIDAQFYDLSLEEFIDTIQAIDPSYVGISILTTEYKEILHIAVAAIRRCLPEVTIIAGGVHVTIEYMDVMSDKSIDFAVIGDGEFVLRDLLSYLEGAGELPQVGLVYRNDGELITQSRAVIDDLSTLPMPKYELVRMQDYVTTAPRIGPNRPPEMPYARIVITRGCPVACSFCQVENISGKRVRSPSPEQVVDELVFLRDHYGIRSFLIDDDNIVIKKQFFKKLLRIIIESDLGLTFSIGAFAIFNLDDEVLKLMVDAGCRSVNIAIESGNQRVMDEIVKKPLQLESVQPLIEKLHDAGLSVLANFIIGFPNETWTEIRESIAFAENCGADYVKIFVAVPLKGTIMWDIAIETGAISVPVGSGDIDWRVSQITSDEWTPEDVSILRVYEWDRINFGTKLKRAKVAEMWGVTENELLDIRKMTRDGLIHSLIDADRDMNHVDNQAATPARKWSDPGTVDCVETSVRIDRKL